MTIRSGKQQVVRFRFACDKSLRYIIDHVAFLSLRWSEWARAYYDEQRAGSLVPPGAARPKREVAENHLCDVGAPGAV